MIKYGGTSYNRSVCASPPLAVRIQPERYAPFVIKLCGNY
jgi:hypothetical protein